MLAFSARMSADTGFESFQVRSTVSAPCAQRPLTEPVGHAEGSAGSSSM